MYSQEYKNMGESIYNLIPKTPEKIVKPDRYRSKFKSSVENEQNANKMDCKTMGPAEVTLNDPGSFMKKRSKLPNRPSKADFKYPDDEKRRPKVPNHAERPAMGAKSTKNFIRANAVENIMSVPKKSAANFADTKNGAIQQLESSGMTPMYIKKREYGKAPKYLVQRKELTAKLQKDYDDYVKGSLQRGAMKCLSELEMQNIICGLKTNWEEIHHQYQGLSVVTDTAPKKNRKERMEAEMDQLEKDIELLEKHAKIYISSDTMY